MSVVAHTFSVSSMPEKVLKENIENAIYRGAEDLLFCCQKVVLDPQNNNSNDSHKIKPQFLIHLCH